MNSSKVLILKMITVIFFLGGCAPEDGGKKVKSVSFYLSNETDYSIQNVFVSVSEDDSWGNDRLILPTLGSASIYIGEIECDQQLDFRVDFFPATIGEHKKYNYFITPAIKTTKPSHSELWGG
jgi:hypothetical protein